MIRPIITACAALTRTPADRLGVEYPALHLLRTLAAICIFTGHWSEVDVIELFPQGQLAIDMFFMIEGFLAARLLGCERSSPPGALVLARLRHVYPLYLASLVAGFVAIAPDALAASHGWTITVWTRALVSGASLLPMETTLIHGSVYPLNPPSWAIVLELIGFAALSYAGRRSPRFGPLLLWLGGAVVLLGCIAIWHDPNMGWRADRYWGGVPRMAFGFFGGALLYRLHVHASSPPRLHGAAAALCCCAFVAIQFLRIRLIAWPLLAIVLPLLVLMAARVDPPRWLARLGSWTGERALAVYLFGFPIMMGWRVLDATLGIPPAIAGSVLGFALVLATILLAAELWTRAVAEVALRPNTARAQAAARV